MVVAVFLCNEPNQMVINFTNAVVLRMITDLCVLYTDYIN